MHYQILGFHKISELDNYEKGCTGPSFQTTIRFFILDEEALEYIEVDHHEFEQAEGVIEYERNTIAEHGVSQICLTKVIGA